MPNRRFVRHPIQNLWAVIAPGRLRRPDETGVVGIKNLRQRRIRLWRKKSKIKDQKLEGEKSRDPFAPGHERMTPTEVFRIGKGGLYEPGWQVRVVPNKYPIFDFHEVVVLHPEPLDFGEISNEHAALVFHAYRERYNALKDKGLVFIFHNVGRDAGASLAHPHSQIAVIPKELLPSFMKPPITSEVAAAPRTELCSGTGGKTPWRWERKNIIRETDNFVVFCPEFSQWPYEAWVLRKAGKKKEFGDSSDRELEELATLLNQLMKKMKEVLGKDVAYNFYMCPGEDWYLRLFPRLNIWGPVELGAGIAVNPVDPAEAARNLRF